MCKIFTGLSTLLQNFVVATRVGHKGNSGLFLVFMILGT